MFDCDCLMPAIDLRALHARSPTSNSFSFLFKCAAPMVIAFCQFRTNNFLESRASSLRLLCFSYIILSKLRSRFPEADTIHAQIRGFSYSPHFITYIRFRNCVSDEMRNWHMIRTLSASVCWTSTRGATRRPMTMANSRNVTNKKTNCVHASNFTFSCAALCAVNVFPVCFGL